ncbi:hypothetical protein [Enterococcus faecalis]|uniref:hypothetical protein n=1 Tax=Enterococcus faecalis TaxID=1351 RepID=UPI002FBF1093
MSLIVLSISYIEPISALAETSDQIQQTVTAIDNATNYDGILVEKDVKINETIQVSDDELSVTLPETADGEIQLIDDSENINITLPEQFTSEALDTGDTAIYSGEGSNLGLQNTDSGFRALISINEPNTSHEYSFTIDLPEGYQLFDASQLQDKAPGTGDIYILDEEGLPVNMIDAAWAKDSEGNSVPTRYVINGNTLTQIIDFDEENFLPIVADPNWVKLGKKWYNKRSNVATAIDVALIAVGIGATAKTSSAVIKLIRSNRRNITRTVERKIAKALGKNAASWVGTAINIGLTIGGTSIGDLIAKGLDKADGRYDGYIFA